MIDFGEDFGPSGTVFVSDLHVGSSFSREELFRSFLEALPGGTRVVLVGDAFDFWKHLPTDEWVWALKDVDSYYLVGNHDSEVIVGSAYTPRVCRSLGMTVGKVRFLVTHGDVFDDKFGDNGFLHRVLDWAVYRASLAIGSDLRTGLGFLTRYYYGRVTNYIEKVNSKLKAIGYGGLVYGHTHCPEFEKRDGFWNVNLGCWYGSGPRALFVRNGGLVKYVSVEEGFRVPPEEDFVSLG